jgi:hypothetical protein
VAHETGRLLVLHQHYQKAAAMSPPKGRLGGGGKGRFREVVIVATSREVFGKAAPRHAWSAAVIWPLRWLSEGKYAEAEKENRAVLDYPSAEMLGPEHPDTLLSRNNLAAALQEQGKLNRGRARVP